MKKSFKITIALIIIATLTVGIFVFNGGLIKSAESVIDIYTEAFSDVEKMSYSELYYNLSDKEKNETDIWRQGMISGNGLQGVITSGAPYSDTLIYQNMHFIMPNKNVRYCPDTSDELEYVKQSIANGENITDDASYDDVYSFHPGGALRIDSAKRNEKNYIRYTDYETAQVGVEYDDINGHWKRTTFTSKSDGVTITKIGESSKGKKVNITLSFDDISTYANFGNGNEVDLKYNKIVGENCDYLAFVAHYPDYENSELKNGGYATLVYVIAEGGAKEETTKGKCKDAQYCGEKTPAIKISDADTVYLIALSDRTYDMGEYDDFEKAESYALVDELSATTKAIKDKYTAEGRFDYDKALESHTALFTPEFNAVTFKLGDDNSTAPNEKLVEQQYKQNELVTDLMERVYYSGRYAYLCAAGYSTTRLYGMWIGEWAPGWGSKYTMDANVNLQTSSMNTSNMESAYIGYASFILRQVADWEENAKATHGFDDAIQAPVNTDGDKAVITETCYPYPFRYWNAGASWMLQPLYETLLCYGDVKIPITDEFDLYKLSSVLSLSETDLTKAEIDAMYEKGYLDLRSEILLPLLTKSANYWKQLMSTEYYTDKDGKIVYEEGKTELLDGEKYAILPSYSPENNPENYPSPSVANSAIDISACKSNLEMLMNIIKSVDENADISSWQELYKNIPDYLFDETGAIKEWATTDFTENNLHRHLSHLYCVWPMFETQDNQALYDASVKAIENRASENNASHALVHRALIGARLKDAQTVTDSLVGLTNNWIYYDSLMTNHDTNRWSCYCTDFGIGYLGIINESLIYSNKGEVEILPALAVSGFDKGEISGIRIRSQAVVDSLEWDIEEGIAKVTITSDIDQELEVSCGLSDKSEVISFSAGESITIEFKIL